MRSDDLEVAILLTVAYTDQFDFPLTREEIFQRLLFLESETLIEHTSQTKLNSALERMVRNGLLQQKNGYFSLTGRDTLLKIRTQKHEFSRKKWAQIEKLRYICRFIPWVEGVFVTGSLAVDSAHQNDDIDLLIITKTNRLWLSRLVILLASSLLGKRRAWNADVKGLAAVQDSWCFNLWLDTAHLKTATTQQNVYIAYEILQAKNIFSRNKIEQTWLIANTWIGAFFPVWYKQKTQQLAEKHQNNKSNWSVNQILERVFDWPLSFLDWLLFRLQYLYMLPHMTTEHVTRGEAFFHPRNTKQMLYQKWNYSLVRLFARLAQNQKKELVLATGVFDLLHQEHTHFLRKAKKAGQLLFVGVESDVRVKQMKGAGRPINNQALRAQNLRELEIADAVFILPEQFSKPADHQRLIYELKPAVLAVSSHTAHLDKKQAILKKVGGTVKVVHQHNPKVSTTAILKSGTKK